MSSDCGDSEDCTEALHELYQFLDGVLTDDKRAAIAAHLDDCSPCLGAFDFERDLREVIARCCRDEVPEELRRRILAAIESDLEPTSE